MGAPGRPSARPLQEEPDPALPVARGPDPLEELVVALSLLLEVKAEIEERLSERALVAENERDEEVPEPAVAVEERVNGLELNVDQGSLQQRGRLDPIVVDEFLETSPGANKRKDPLVFVRDALGNIASLAP